MKKRVWIRLDDDDIEWLNALGYVTGIKERSKQVMFCLKLLRLIMPNIDRVLPLVKEVMSRDEGKG